MHVRLHDEEGEDLGFTHVPAPVEVGDVVATVDAEYTVINVVVSPPGVPIEALVQVERWDAEDS